MRTRWTRTTALLLGTTFGLLAVACGNSTTAASPTVSSVSVTGSAPDLGGTAQFVATATLSDGTAQNVTASATWQSADSSIAAVSSSGVVTGVGAGSVSISATYQNVAGADQITIPAP